MPFQKMKTDYIYKKMKFAFCFFLKTAKIVIPVSQLFTYIYDYTLNHNS